jgi:hypothetical protein
MCTNVLTGDDMAGARPTRFNVVLDEVHAAKLYLMAERMYLQPGALARSLLSTALDTAEPDPKRITELLDGIPGAWESIEAAEADYAAGRFIPLEDWK